MPLPGHRLDLLVVGVGEGAGARVQAAWEDLAVRGIVTSDGWAGSEAAWLVGGGFARAMAEIHDRPRLWANQAGGFRVRCPRCGRGLARELGASVESGAPVSCPGCEVASAIGELDFAPPAAWGTAALALRDVATASLTAEGARWASEILGNHRLVWRRP